MENMPNSGKRKKKNHEHLKIVNYTKCRETTEGMTTKIKMVIKVKT